MAAALRQSSDFQKKVKDITICTICMQTITDPRILPCIHTFCAKCLETKALKFNFTAGHPMPCPMCRKDFQIPVDGVTEMPKDFFVAKLLEMPDLKNLPQTPVVCDACSDDYPILFAKLFCRKCCIKLCESCSRHHQRSKLTKDHELSSVYKSFAMTEMASVQDVCDVHESEILQMYCSQCMKVVCALCFIENHQNHYWLRVSKVGEGYRQQIEIGMENIRQQSRKIEAKKNDVFSSKADVDKIVSSKELWIYAEKNALIQLIEEIVGTLISELEQKGQEKLNEIKIEEEECDFQIQIQESYTRYCHEMVTKGSTVDICRMQSVLQSRAEELQRMSQSVCQRKTKPFQVDLKLNRFDELQKYIEQNFPTGFEGEAEEEQFKKGSELVPQFGEKRVTGMAIIDQELFVTITGNSTVQVYDSKSLKLKRSWSVTGLTCPEDMAASERAKILYIFDAVGRGKIYRINPDGRALSSWVTGRTQIRISTSLEPVTSINSEAKVIMTYVGASISKEFEPSTQPKLLNTVVLKSNCNFVRKLDPSHYLLATAAGVCSASISESVSYQSSPVVFCRPEEIVVDQTTGFIFVNDRGNRRVVMLNSNLEYKKAILPEDGLCDPRCMVLDAESRRLIIADYDKVSKGARMLALKIE